MKMELKLVSIRQRQGGYSLTGYYEWAFFAMRVRPLLGDSKHVNVGVRLTFALTNEARRDDWGSGKS